MQEFHRISSNSKESNPNDCLQMTLFTIQAVWSSWQGVEKLDELAGRWMHFEPSVKEWHTWQDSINGLFSILGTAAFVCIELLSLMIYFVRGERSTRSKLSAMAITAKNVNHNAMASFQSQRRSRFPWWRGQLFRSCSNTDDFSSSTKNERSFKLSRQVSIGRQSCVNLSAHVSQVDDGEFYFPWKFDSSKNVVEIFFFFFDSGHWYIQLQSLYFYMVDCFRNSSRFARKRSISFGYWKILLFQ